jgi:FixJ family two-component response regulator
MNGKVLYEQVAKSFPESKVLYMSGYTENVICHHGVLDDGVAFLQKPFSIHDLYVKVREVFDRE